MTREEKRQARIERYEERARKAEQQSRAAYTSSNNAVAGIVPGQPILVGHHSERAHQAALDRSWASMGQSVALSDKAEYYRDKALAAENNTAIYSDDEDAVKKLKDKVAGLEMLQEHMKQANKIIRDKKLSDEQKLERLVSETGLTQERAAKLLQPDYCGRIGYPSYRLTNNNANLRTAKARLEQVARLQSTPVKEYEVNGIRVVENSEANRFQIFFGYKPDEQTRSKLKHAGYRWSPSEECWQCYMKSWNINQGKEILNALQV